MTGANPMKILSLLLCFLLTFPIEATASLFRRRKLSIVNGQLPPIDTTDLDSSNSSASTPLRSSQSSHELRTPCHAIDYSTAAVSRRLEIYLRNGDASAFFCELKGNRAAASLAVFERLTPAFLEILFYPYPPNHKMFHGKTFSSVGFIGSIFTIFINFNVDITQATVLKNFDMLKSVIRRLKAHYRPILAFFVLIRDFKSISEFRYKESVNFYGVNRAIMMLPFFKAKAETITLLYNTFGSDLLDHYKIPKRIFRDAPEIGLCQLLVEKGFKPLDHPSLFIQCRLHRNHPKWDYFIEVYGNAPVVAHLESDWFLKPEKSGEPKKNLPFKVCPIRDQNHPRWDLYARAYGHEIVLAHKFNA